MDINEAINTQFIQYAATMLIGKHLVLFECGDKLEFILGDAYPIGQKITPLDIFDKRTADEMSSSNYNYKLQEKMKLVKANACLYYKELLKEATNERHQEDFNKKHGNIALKGFDRYDTFFEYPDRDANGSVIGFTRYKATIVVRLASDDKFYLYDIIDIKKMR